MSAFWRRFSPLPILLGCLTLAVGLASASPAQAQSLKVTLLGTSNPNPVINRFGPSILVQAGGENLLFDCGRGATIRLWQLRIPLGTVNTLFLTHLHSDHVVGIPDLWLTGWLPAPFGRRTVPLQVSGPAGTKEMMSYLERAFQWDIRIRKEDQKLPDAGVAVMASDITEGIVFEKNGVKVTAFEVDHGDTIKPTLGYRVDYGGRSVVLSGDTRPVENLVRFSRGADVVIHEVSSAREDLVRRSEAVRRILAHHTTPEDAGKIFGRIKPKLAVYSHISLPNDPLSPPVTPQELLDFTRRTYSGPLEVGEDLMVIEVGDTVKVSRPAK